MTRPSVAVVQVRIDAADPGPALARVARALGAAGAVVECIAVADADAPPGGPGPVSADYDSGGW